MKSNKKPSTQDLTQMDGINLTLTREILTTNDLNYISIIKEYTFRFYFDTFRKTQDCDTKT
jgi:hypothetical protein